MLQSSISPCCRFCISTKAVQELLPEQLRTPRPGRPLRHLPTNVLSDLSKSLHHTHKMSLALAKSAWSFLSDICCGAECMCCSLLSQLVQACADLRAQAAHGLPLPSTDGLHAHACHRCLC